MSTFVPKEVQDGLDAARQAAQASRARLRVLSGNDSFAVLRMWDGGFAMAKDGAPHLRGHVDLFEGDTHLFQCLVVASECEAHEMRYDFKRLTAVSGQAPLDFEKAANAPIALIEHQAPHTSA